MKPGALTLCVVGGLSVVTLGGLALAFGLNAALDDFGGAVVESAEWSAAAPTEYDADLGELTLHTVLPDATLDPEADGDEAAAWDLFVRVIGVDAAAEQVATYASADAPRSDTLAYVEEASEPGRWTLAINLAAMAGDQQLLFATLLHEYAHILSLAPGEFSSGGGACPTVAIQEGCAAEDSYLWDFYDRFWAGYSDAPEVDNVDPDAAYDFYLSHEHDFVGDYAATNVSEDLAETFMTYVLESDWSTKTVVGQKLEFFNGYPELVELRDRIRAEFAGEYGLP